MTKSRLVGFILIGLAAEVVVVLSVINAFGNGLTPIVGAEIALGLFIAVIADYVAAKEIMRRNRTLSDLNEENPEYEDEERDYQDENGFCEDDRYCSDDCCDCCGCSDDYDCDCCTCDKEEE